MESSQHQGEAGNDTGGEQSVSPSVRHLIEKYNRMVLSQAEQHPVHHREKELHNPKHKHNQLHVVGRRVSMQELTPLRISEPATIKTSSASSAAPAPNGYCKSKPATPPRGVNLAGCLTKLGRRLTSCSFRWPRRRGMAVESKKPTAVPAVGAASTVDAAGSACSWREHCVAPLRGQLDPVLHRAAATAATEPTGCPLVQGNNSSAAAATAADQSQGGKREARDVATVECIKPHEDGEASFVELHQKLEGADHSTNRFL